MIKLKTILSEIRNREEQEKSIQQWLEKQINSALGKDRSEKLEWLWNNEPRYWKVVDALSKFYQYRPKRPVDAVKSERFADRYYVRFGDLPKGGKSMNHFRKKEEKGISAYPVKWSQKHNMWLMSTADLSEDGLNTLDSMISDFLVNRGRPILLIQGQELNDVGYDDGEPLLDMNQIKIVKKIHPSELWIDYYNGNDWWK